MSRRKNKKTRKNGKNQISPTLLTHQGVGSTKVTGRYYSRFTASAVANTFTITELPLRLGSFGSRVNSMFDLYEYWRLDRLRATAIPTGTTANLCTFMMGWIPLPLSEFTTATGVANFIDFPEVRLFSPTVTVPQVIRVNNRDTATQGKWLYTNTNNTDVVFDAGVFMTAALTGNTTNSPYFDFYIEFEITFKGPIDPSLNPLSPEHGIMIGPGVREKFEASSEEKKGVVIVPSTYTKRK